VSTWTLMQGAMNMTPSQMYAHIFCSQIKIFTTTKNKMLEM